MKNIFLFLFLLTSLIKAETITITSDEWCPYNCENKGNKQGFFVDIFTYVFQQYGYKVKYVISDSFTKAIKDVRQNKYDALISTNPEETPDFIFPKLPMTYSYDVILIPKDSSWICESETSLNELTLGVVQGYVYTDPIQRYVENNINDSKKIQMISGNHSMKYNLKKLKHQKITAMIDNYHLIQYHYASKQEPFPFKVAKKMEPYPLYIAFSPKNYKSEKYVEMFDRGYKKLLHTKKMKEILQKYGLSEISIAKPK